MASDRQVRIGQISVSTTPSVAAPKVRIGDISISTTPSVTLVDIWSTLTGLGKFQLYVWNAAQSKLIPAPLQQWSASLNELVPVLSDTPNPPTPLGGGPTTAPFTGSGSITITGKASFGVGAGGGSTTPLPAEGNPQAAISALTSVWTPTRGLYTFSNFSQGTPPYAYGLYVAAAKSYGINGPGTLADLVLEMVPYSSTMASYVPTSGTNQLYLVRIGGTGGPTVTVQDFTLNGTPQGHLYNGFWLYYAAGAQASDILITGVPGNSDSPPGETFPFATYNSPNAVLSNIEVDGRDWSTGVAGAKVSASNMGINNSNGVSLTSINTHHTGYGHGIAFYESSNLTVTSVTSTDNDKNGMNFEEAGGTINIYQPTLLRNSGSHLCFNASTSKTPGGAIVNIYDAVFDGPLLTIEHGTTYTGSGASNPAQSQKAANIHNWVTTNGVYVARNDLLSIQNPTI